LLFGAGLVGPLSLRSLIEATQMLHQRGIGFVSVTKAIDTTTHGGKMVFHVVGALAEFERDLTKERTNAGLASAKARGVQLGRPRTMTDAQIAVARSLEATGELSSGKIAEHLGVSRAALYRTLNQ